MSLKFKIYIHSYFIHFIVTVNRFSASPFMFLTLLQEWRKTSTFSTLP